MHCINSLSHSISSALANVSSSTVQIYLSLHYSFSTKTWVSHCDFTPPHLFLTPLPSHDRPKFCGPKFTDFSRASMQYCVKNEHDSDFWCKMTCASVPYSQHWIFMSLLTAGDCIIIWITNMHITVTCYKHKPCPAFSCCSHSDQSTIS